MLTTARENQIAGDTERNHSSTGIALGASSTGIALGITSSSSSWFHKNQTRLGVRFTHLDINSSIGALLLN